MWSKLIVLVLVNVFLVQSRNLDITDQLHEEVLVGEIPFEPSNENGYYVSSINY